MILMGLITLTCRRRRCCSGWMMNSDAGTTVDGKILRSQERQVILPKTPEVMVVDPILKLMDRYLIRRWSDPRKVLIDLTLGFRVWDRG